MSPTLDLLGGPNPIQPTTFPEASSVTTQL
jgi:hypothetical protein